MIIFSGSQSKKLAEGVSAQDDLEPGVVEVRQFPDSEFYVRILSGVRGKSCGVIQSMPDPNNNLVEMLLILGGLRDCGAKNITAVVPYLAYARQDKKFKEGEAVSARTILGILDEFSDRIITVNSHFLDNAGRFKPYGIELENLDAFPLVAEYFRDKLKNPVVIAPDKGAVGYAKNAARIIDCDFDYLEKTRISDDKVEMSIKNLDVGGKDALILDDMISTGGTIIEAARLLRRKGAGSVSAGCVHGLFTKGLERFRGEVDEIACTDTLETGVSKVGVGELIARAIPY